MASIERRQRGGRSAPVRWRVCWRDEAGRSRSKTFEREDEARRFRVRLEGELAAGVWVDPALSRVTLGEWTPAVAGHSGGPASHEPGPHRRDGVDPRAA